jgi:hypothetical protein
MGPPVTTDNVYDLIAQTENDPDLALEVLRGIKNAAAHASGKDLALLQAAGLKAAANASGLGAAMLNHAGDLTNAFADGDKTRGIVKDSIGELDNLEETGAILADTLPDPGDTAAFAAFVEASSADDLTMAAAVLLASEAKSRSDSSSYIDSFDSQASGHNEKETLAIKLAAAASKKYDDEGGTGPLKDILAGLNLISSP